MKIRPGREEGPVNFGTGTRSSPKIISRYWAFMSDPSLSCLRFFIDRKCPSLNQRGILLPVICRVTM